MVGRTLAWLKATAELGRYYMLTRKPHIEAKVPAELGPGPWVAIATRDPILEGKPVYGTAAHRAVAAGEVLLVLVPEGTYRLYVVEGADPTEGLRQFYARPESAHLIEEKAVSRIGL